MALPNIFTPEVTNEIIHRINQLTPATKAQWGKMNVGQMLAHCNVTYEMMYENNHPKPGAFMRWILKRFVKTVVVSETPYPKNNKTAPAFMIKGVRDFEKEKARLIAYLIRTKDLGEKHFDNAVSHSFGNLSITEWNNMFYKHLNHHLAQFGV